jgi:hypothetical protein
VRLAEIAPHAIAPGNRLFRVCRDGAPMTGEPVREVVSLGRAEVAYVLPELTAAGTPPAAAAAPPVIQE